MVLSLKFPKMRSSVHILVLNVSYRSITSSLIMTWVQFDHRRSFPVTCRLYWGLGWLLQIFDICWLCSGVHTHDLPGHILLDRGLKYSCIPRQFQGRVVHGLLCWKVLRLVSTAENPLDKNSSGNKMNYH